MLATILAMLDIAKLRGRNGKEMDPDVKFENSVFRSVFFSPIIKNLHSSSTIHRTSTRFAVVLRPRSDAVLKLIEEET
jgi:hypothetical protein